MDTLRLHVFGQPEDLVQQRNVICGTKRALTIGVSQATALRLLEVVSSWDDKAILAAMAQAANDYSS